eukprot:3852607-Rhodomonas_salina.1
MQCDAMRCDAMQCCPRLTRGGAAARLQAPHQLAAQAPPLQSDQRLHPQQVGAAAEAGAGGRAPESAGREPEEDGCRRWRSRVSGPRPVSTTERNGNPNRAYTA